MADLATFAADLPESGSAEIIGVHRDGRPALGTTVAFERSNSEVFLERGCQPLGQLFRPCHYKSQAAEVLRGTTAHIKLQERGCCQQEGQPILADEWANVFRIQRVGVI